MILGKIGDFLFGESPDAQVQQQTTQTPEQQRKLKQLLKGLNLPSGLGEPGAAFGGQLSAGSNKLESLSLEALEQQALGQVAGEQRTQQVAEDTLQQLLLADPTDFEEFFTESVEKPALQSFQERILPAIKAKQAKNFFSSDRLSQEARATEDLLDSLTGARAELAFGSREAAKNRQLTALGLVDTITGLPTRQAIERLKAGQIPREIEQAGLNREYAEFLRQQQAKETRVNQILSALGLQGVENIATVTPGSTGAATAFAGSSGGSELISAGISAAIPYIMGFFSAEELKEDISVADEYEILEGLEKLDIKRWKYKGEETPHVGPMAGDFQEIFSVGDGVTIHLADVAGVLLASNKALAKKIEALYE